MIDFLLRLLLAIVLGYGLYVITLAALDAHQRGCARVMRGQSWTPKGGRR